MTTLSYEMTTDYLGYDCIEEVDLDAAFQSGKYSQVPQTCLPKDMPREPETLAWALGRPPTEAEWATFNYKWFSANDPDRALFGVSDDIVAVASAPAPWGLILLLTALVLLALWRRRVPLATKSGA